MFRRPLHRDWLVYLFAVIIFAGVRSTISSYTDPATDQFDITGQEAAFFIDLLVAVGIAAGICAVIHLIRQKVKSR